VSTRSRSRAFARIDPKRPTIATADRVFGRPDEPRTMKHDERVIKRPHRGCMPLANRVNWLSR
jgi:hypothetical protein